jgi:hypothetical protein
MVVGCVACGIAITKKGGAMNMVYAFDGHFRQATYGLPEMPIK